MSLYTICPRMLRQNINTHQILYFVIFSYFAIYVYKKVHSKIQVMKMKNEGLVTCDIYIYMYIYDVVQPHVPIVFVTSYILVVVHVSVHTQFVPHSIK